jgi:deazaflavin-dependent oxidoreductase (nitroreductase family)
MARRWEESNALQRAVRRFAASGPGSWLFSRMLDRLDRLIFRVTKGRHMASSLLSALPVAMVTTRGARSGQARTVPLLAMPTDDGLAVIGSNYGKPKHPAWRHNLRANPDGEVEVEGRRWAFSAVELEDDRRERVWQEALRTYPGFSGYATRAAPRRISVFILEPQLGSGGRDMIRVEG